MLLARIVGRARSGDHLSVPTVAREPLPATTVHIDPRSDQTPATTAHGPPEIAPFKIPEICIHEDLKWNSRPLTHSSASAAGGSIDESARNNSRSETAPDATVTVARRWVHDRLGSGRLIAVRPDDSTSIASLDISIQPARLFEPRDIIRVHAPFNSLLRDLTRRHSSFECGFEASSPGVKRA